MVGLIYTFITLYIIRLCLTLCLFFILDQYELKEGLNLHSKKDVIFFIAIPLYIPVWLVKLIIRKLNNNFK